MARIFTQTFAVAGALVEREGKIFLVRENLPGDPDDGKLSHPAGWLDVGEDPIEAAKREVREETGYEFTPEHLLGVYSIVREDLKNFRGATPHAVKLIFTGRIGAHSKNNLLGDTSGGEWFLPEVIMAMDKDVLRDLDIKQMVKDLVAGKRYPLEVITHTISPDVN